MSKDSKQTPFSNNWEYLEELEVELVTLTDKFCTTGKGAITRREWLRLEEVLRLLNKGDLIGTYRAAIQLPKD